MGIRTIKTIAGRIPKKIEKPQAGKGIVSGAALGGAAKPKLQSGARVGGIRGQGAISDREARIRKSGGAVSDKEYRTLQRRETMSKIKKIGSAIAKGAALGGVATVIKKKRQTSNGYMVR